MEAMKFLDINSLSIGIGAVGALLYLATMLIRRREFNPIDASLVFIAIVTIATGFEMIYVAIIGDIERLNESWKVYITVAAIIGIGVAMQKLIYLLQAAFSKKPLPKDDEKI